MGLSGPNRKLSATERFLGVPSHAPPHFPSVANDDFHEDDVVFFSGDYSASTPSSSTSSSSSATPNHLIHHHHHHHDGILAALPENETSRNLRNVSQHFHKASISSISSSSSRTNPSIPRPPTPAQPSSVNFHHSAPVNVPILSMKARRRHLEFDEDDEEEEEEEMMPPHEIVARNSSQSPMLACSVLEGIGRTLKGRDLRQVRNAVWRQTGFLG
ncbi:nuclear transcription factor Y subunit gamma [Cajanus cajan]|nr:nuclear transcription factor Y subunit gamma [Cajanus cajan]